MIVVGKRDSVSFNVFVTPNRLTTFQSQYWLGNTNWEGLGERSSEGRGWGRGRNMLKILCVKNLRKN